MTHWSTRYIGREHKKGVYDCASLAIDVQKEVFNRDVVLPVERRDYSYSVLSEMIDEHKFSVAEKVEEPQEGDAVLMFSNNRRNHIGIYTVIDGIPYVLHNMQKAGVVLHRLRDIGKGALMNYAIEGYYRWK